MKLKDDDFGMIINDIFLDELTAKAKQSPRLQMEMDLRNSPEDYEALFDYHGMLRFARGVI